MTNLPPFKCRCGRRFKATRSYAFQIHREACNGLCPTEGGLNGAVTNGQGREVAVFIPTGR